MKDSIIEINNLQGNNSRVNEAENQINDLEHKEEKRTTNRNKKKKRESPQNEETKKYGPDQRTDQNSRKKNLNKMEICNLSDAKFKTLVIRMLKDLSEDLNSIKKTQAEMKVILS